MTGTRRGRPASGSELTSAAVVAVARELLRDEGVERLSMRRLAARLGVDVSSLYWHVRNKDALLDLLADDLMAGARPPDPGLPWREQLEAVALEFRRLLLAHRDAAKIVAGRWVTGPNTLRAMERLVTPLLAAGFEGREAAQVGFLLSSYVTGFVLQELSPMNAAEARGAAPEEVLAQANRELKALPAEEFPSLLLVADDLTARTMEERFRLGLDLTLSGLEERRRRATGERNGG
ncbi:TetR/AcrR family transcriptional regulator [Sphaerisporangium fuscum]|uniref:TetR/AcrR family transcriptional regulator n=1 Tax=Sphaerisporangium fuscum TaxID=2835868 RepID=UPI001BDD2DBE|nr:TetR/AcrR family transcriptional regulator [Sphaerisporangium fuscum]